MSTNNTPGRLAIGRDNRIETADGSEVICTIWMGNKANARRIVACWNACDGIDTPSLEAINNAGVTLRQKLAGAQSQMIELEQQHDRLKENNAELLEALQLFVRWAADETIPTREAMEQACAAITNATSQLTSERPK